MLKLRLHQFCFVSAKPNNLEGKKLKSSIYPMIDLAVYSQDRIGSLNKVMNIFRQNGAKISYLRSNFTGAKMGKTRTYRIDLSYQNILDTDIGKIISNLEDQSFSISEEAAIKMPWFPKRLDELNLLENRLMEVTEPFEDLEYKRRRDQIARRSFSHRMGGVIEGIEYTKEENEVWENVYKKTKLLREQRMSPFYLQSLKELERDIPMNKKIPQLQQLSTYLEAITGFRLKPIHGMISVRKFLNHLAFKIFCCTQYIRNWKTPDYTYEPDIIHEFLGHMPTLAHPTLALISQKIGLLSLGASSRVINQLATIYFFVLEFGTIKTGNMLSGYGAGFPGCLSELENMNSALTKYLKFDPFVDCKRRFPINTVQPTYLYTESLEETISLIQNFGKTLEKPISTVYNQTTQQIQYDRSIEFFQKEEEIDPETKEY